MQEAAYNRLDLVQPARGTSRSLWKTVAGAAFFPYDGTY